MTLDEFRNVIQSRDLKPVPSGTGFVCRCPAHEDSSPSLSVGEGADRRILLHCHAGCATEAVLSALGLQPKDLFVEERPALSRFGVLPKGEPSPARAASTHNAPRIPLTQVAVYPYHDRMGEVVFEVVRYEPKTFRQRVPDATESSGYRYSTKGIDKPLFHLPALVAAVSDRETVYVVEGEKDVLALESLGLVATTNPGGAGKFTAAQAETLSQASVVIIADRDLPGIAHATDVEQKLTRAGASSVTVFILPDRGGVVVKDPADFVAAGGTAAEIAALVANPPAMIAPPPAPAQSHAQRTTNNTPAPNGARRGSFGAIFLPNEPKIRGDLLSEILGIKSDPALKDAADRRRELIADEVAAALCRLGQFYYNSDLKIRGGCMFFDRNRKILLLVESDLFQSWLCQWACIKRSEKTWETVIKTVQDIALSGPYTKPVVPEAYWAQREDALGAVTLYVSNGDGAVIRIAAAGLRLVDNGTDGVLFEAGKTLSPWKLVPPSDPFTTCRLFSGMKTTDANGSLLAKLWMYSMPTAEMTKPPALFTGEVGAGKTRTARGIAELYGIPEMVQKVQKDKEDDFWIAVNSGGMLVLDNADTKTVWLADALAAAATGGTVTKRVLYTNSDQMKLRSRAWVVVTSANPAFASDAGLADRLAVVRMERDEQDTEDKSLSKEVATNRDAALSHIVTTLQTAVADKTPHPVGLNYRFPDFGRFALRIGRALGLESEALTALSAAERDKSVICFENDAVLSALLEFIDGIGSFRGTSKELCDQLAAFEPAIADSCTPKRLGKRIRSHWAHVKAMMTAFYEENSRKSATFFLKSKQNNSEKSENTGLTEELV